MAKLNEVVKDVRGLVWVFAVLIAVGVAFAGCGGEEEETAAAPPEGSATKMPQETPPPEPSPEPPPAPVRGPAPGPVQPVTLEVLKLMPESTSIAMAIPPFKGMLDKAVALAKRVAPEDTEVDAMMEMLVMRTAMQMGTPEAKSFAEIMRAKGFDPESPVAFFIDASPMEEGLKAFVEKAREEAESAKQEPEEKEAPPSHEEPAPAEPAAPATNTGGAAAEAESADVPPETEAAEPPDAARETEEDMAGPQPVPPQVALAQKQAQMFQELIAQTGLPDMAFVVGVAEPVLAEATLKAVLAQAPAVNAADVEDIETDGLVIHHYPSSGFSYFFKDEEYLVVGNALEYVKGVAARFDDPAILRYGSVECPAEELDECVMLMRLDELKPLIEAWMPIAAALNPEMAPLIEAQSKILEQQMEVLSGSDPVVTTFAWTDDKMEILSRLDMTKHEAMMAMAGEAAPLRLARLLPDNTAAMLAFRLTDEYKATMEKAWFGALPPELQNDPQAVQGIAMAKQWFGLIGNEIALGVSKGPAIFPNALVLVGLTDAEQARNMVQMMMPAVPTETYAEVDILNLPLPFVSVQILYAFTDNTAIVGTDIAQIKSVIDMLAAGESSNLFESLEPPMDPAAPLYSAFVVRNTILTDIVTPLMMMGGQAPPEVQSTLATVRDTFTELRATGGAEGDWMESRMTIYMTPGE